MNNLEFRKVINESIQILEGRERLPFSTPLGSDPESRNREEPSEFRGTVPDKPWWLKPHIQADDELDQGISSFNLRPQIVRVYQRMEKATNVLKEIEWDKNDDQVHHLYYERILDKLEIALDEFLSSM